MCKMASFFYFPIKGAHSAGKREIDSKVKNYKVSVEKQYNHIYGFPKYFHTKKEALTCKSVYAGCFGVKIIKIKRKSKESIMKDLAKVRGNLGKVCWDRV